MSPLMRAPFPFSLADAPENFPSRAEFVHVIFTTDYIYIIIITITLFDVCLYELYFMITKLICQFYWNISNYVV